jgi:prepilin-type N-terminal cleavage/methylation domain-containing protein
MKSARHTPNRPLPSDAPARRAFTLLELMLALAIFGMVLAAIYTTWTAVLRASRVGNDVAASAQRTRVASRTVEDALLSVVFFQANGPLYSFEADTSQDYASLSLVSRLPPSFPGSGFFGDLVVRRVSFTVEGGPDGTNELVLRQLPILQAEEAETNTGSIVLARDVRLFTLEFLPLPNMVRVPRGEEWLTEWPYTNMLPWAVKFTLGFGGAADAQGRPRDRAVREVFLPYVPVPGQSSFGSAPTQQNPGTDGANNNPNAGGNQGRERNPNTNPRGEPGGNRPGGNRPGGR